MRRLGLLVALLILTAPVWAQTGTKISQMPPGGNATAGDIFPALRGTTSSGFVNYQTVLPLGSTTTAGILQCGAGLNCTSGVISGASFPTLTGTAFEYLTNNGSTVNWSNPASLIDPRTFGASCVGSGNTGGLVSGNNGIWITAAGTGGTNATYTSVPITGGSGSGAVGTFVVAGGIVTSLAITSPGSGYKVRDQISALPANIGNVTGFNAQVANLNALELPIWDGVHDDTAAFQKALNLAQNTGQAVMVPNGCWVSTLNIPKGVSMVGTGYAPTYGEDYDSDTASNMPILYEETANTFVIHFGAGGGNGFFGFEINDSANVAFQTAYCIGTDQDAGAGAPHNYLRGMSFKGCFAGYGGTANHGSFPISIANDYGANVYGMFGHIDDLQSFGDQFDTNSTAGILVNGGFLNIFGDRFEYNGQGINCNCSGMTISSSQFDENYNGAIVLIDGSGQNTIANNTFQGNGGNGVGAQGAIIIGRNTSDQTAFPSFQYISGNTFSKYGTGGPTPTPPATVQLHALEVSTTGIDNDYIYINGGNALSGSTSSFAIYDNGQPPHMKFSGMAGLANFDTLSAPLTASGCSISATNAGPMSGSITSGVTGTCAVTVVPNGTLSLAQAHGWTCGQFSDQTTNANTASWSQLSTTTTSAALSGTTSTGDVVSFSCNPY